MLSQKSKEYQHFRLAGEEARPSFSRSSHSDLDRCWALCLEGDLQ
jgi:hypothetical protein